LVWDKLNGFLSCPLLALLATTVLWGGHRVYARKEVGHHTHPARGALWIILFQTGC